MLVALCIAVPLGLVLGGSQEDPFLRSSALPRYRR